MRREGVTIAEATNGYVVVRVSWEATPADPPDGLYVADDWRDLVSKGLACTPTGQGTFPDLDAVIPKEFEQEKESLLIDGEAVPGRPIGPAIYGLDPHLVVLVAKCLPKQPLRWQIAADDAPLRIDYSDEDVVVTAVIMTGRL
jgi:hypothetical protein